MNLDEIRPRVRLILKKLSPRPEEDDGERTYVEFKPRERFPLPELVLLILRDVLGLPEDMPLDKTRWTIPFAYDGSFYVAELRRFGFTIITEKRHPPGSRLTNEVLGALGQAAGVVEAHLEAFAAAQAKEGAVTVRNDFGTFDETYRFFRARAAAAYGEPTPPPKVVRNEDGTSTSEHDLFKPQREGGHYAGAMMNAYFSRTEHFLVLSLAFTSLDLGGGALVDFIRKKWSEKMRSLFDLPRDKTAKLLHERIKSLRDSLRNPLSHGGFEQGHRSMYFHVPGVGAMPARMTRRKDGVHFVFAPIGHRSFEDICALLDEFDVYLAKRLPYAWAWAESGLDVAYDSKSRAWYASGMPSRDAFERVIESTARGEDRHNNFED